MRKIDRLGRIVIPQELREKYGLTDGTKIDFLDTGEGVTVISAEPFCRLCRAKIPDGRTIPLCEKCISEIIKQYIDV